MKVSGEMFFPRSDFGKFVSSVNIVKIDVLFVIIFHNRQANNYMTSPVPVPLNILRICEKSCLAFITVQRFSM